MWKLALEDALLTLERHWEAAISAARELVARHRGLTGAERHYACWLLYKPERGARDWKRIQAVFTGRDLCPEGVELDAAGRCRVRKYLRRVLRRLLGGRPRVRRARSFTVDRQMYRVFVSGGRQYVALALLDPGNRVVVPLAGVHALEGNLWVVLLPDERAVEVHMSREPRVFPPGDEEVGIDLGVTEVFTDDLGRKYRPEYGRALEEMSGYVLEKGRRRAKLWALHRRNLRVDPARARRLRRHNLGFAKQRKVHGKFRRRCENEVNRALNELFRERGPKVIAYEDLSHLRGKAKSKGLSRKVSGWHRSVVKERLRYKSHVHSAADPGPVNAAYSSQECPECGWVDAANRRGDDFCCQKCGFSADADRVSALNLKRRLRDGEITRYVPAAEVREILLRRYREKASPPGVPGDVGAGRARREKVSGTCAGRGEVHAKAGFDDEAGEAEHRRVQLLGRPGNGAPGRGDPSRAFRVGAPASGRGTTPPFGSPEVPEEDGGAGLPGSGGLRLRDDAPGLQDDCFGRDSRSCGPPVPAAGRAGSRASRRA